MEDLENRMHRTDWLSSIMNDGKFGVEPLTYSVHIISPSKLFEIGNRLKNKSFHKHKGLPTLTKYKAPLKWLYLERAL